MSHNTLPHDYGHTLPNDLQGIEVTAADIAAFMGGGEESDASTNAPISEAAIFQPEIHDDENGPLVEKLRMIRQWFDISEDSTVVYPGSATDIDVARVFGKNNVTHIDPDSAACQALVEHGYAAVSSRIEDYAPAIPFDVMIALNSYGRLSQGEVARLVRPGGYIIANNYTGWATDLKGFNDVVQLVGAVLPSYGHDDAELYLGADIPAGAAEMTTRYYILPPGGGIKAGTRDNHTFTDDGPVYPDGLFIFQRTSRSS